MSGRNVGNTVDPLVTITLKGPCAGYGSPLFTAQALLGWRSYNFLDGPMETLSFECSHW